MLGWFKRPPAGLSRSDAEAYIKKRAAVIVSIFAALLAINTLLGGANSSKILNNTIASNNLWAWYQAKNVRSVVYSATADLLDDQKLVQHYHGEVQRLRGDMDELSAKAKAMEDERDNAKKRSPYYTYAGSLLQIGIVLSGTAILAVSFPLVWVSIAVGLIGAASFFVGWLI